MNVAEQPLFFDQKIDLSGLICPKPLMHTRKIVSLMNKSEVLFVQVTDPSFQIDCEVFARQAGHKLLKSWKEDLKFCFLIQKGH